MWRGRGWPTAGRVARAGALLCNGIAGDLVGALAPAPGGGGAGAGAVEALAGGLLARLAKCEAEVERLLVERAAEAPPRALPAGWRRAVDPVSGEALWVDGRGAAVRGEPPEEEEEEEAAAADGGGGGGAAAEAAEAAEAPAAAEAAADPHAALLAALPAAAGAEEPQTLLLFFQPDSACTTAAISALFGPQVPPPSTAPHLSTRAPAPAPAPAC